MTSTYAGATGCFPAAPRTFMVSWTVKNPTGKATSDMLPPQRKPLDRQSSPTGRLYGGHAHIYFDRKSQRGLFGVLFDMRWHTMIS